MKIKTISKTTISFCCSLLTLLIYFFTLDNQFFHLIVLDIYWSMFSLGMNQGTCIVKGWKLWPLESNVGIIWPDLPISYIQRKCFFNFLKHCQLLPKFPRGDLCKQRKELKSWAMWFCEVFARPQGTGMACSCCGGAYVSRLARWSAVVAGFLATQTQQPDQHCFPLQGLWNLLEACTSQKDFYSEK